jgi:thiamine biosynthesis lipoprotein
VVHNVGRPLIGTLVNLTVIAETQEKAIVASEAAFAEIKRIETLMSPVIKGSDISRINEGAARGPITISPETFDLIAKSKDIWRESGGAFDITFASIARLWDYKRSPFVPPSPAMVRSLRHLVDSGKIVLDAAKKTVRFTKPRMKLGLGAIAKGYAVMRAIEVLRSLGIRNAIVAAGGDIQVMGDKDGEDWITGLIHPRTKEIVIAIKMKDGDAVSTSGDYERFAMYRGVRYHHIIDPATGEPARHFASVSVISRNPVDCDGYDTAMFVMGMEKARKLLERRPDLGAIVIGLDMKVWASASLKGRLVPLKEIEIGWL